MERDLGIYNAPFFHREREDYPNWPEQTGALQERMEDIGGEVERIRERETKRTDELATLKKEIAKLQRIVAESKRKLGNVYIQNLRHPNYVLKESIPISLELEENKVIASYYDIDMYGSGDNEEEAINDLCEVVVEYYESLKEDQGKLGPLPEKHWLHLRRIIEEQ